MEVSNFEAIGEMAQSLLKKVCKNIGMYVSLESNKHGEESCLSFELAPRVMNEVVNSRLMIPHLIHLLFLLFSGSDTPNANQTSAYYSAGNA